MKVEQLSKVQMEELKERYYMENADEEGRGVSYGELAHIDDLVSDSEIMDKYSDYEFVNDDFFCTADGNTENMNIFGYDEENGYMDKEDTIAAYIEEVYESVDASRAAVNAIDFAEKHGRDYSVLKDFLDGFVDDDDIDDFINYLEEDAVNAA